jgi:hypothetical protein
MPTLNSTLCSSTLDRKPAITLTQRRGSAYSCQRPDSIFMEFMREGLRSSKAASRRTKEKLEKTERIPVLVLKQNQGYYNKDFKKIGKFFSLWTTARHSTIFPIMMASAFSMKMNPLTQLCLAYSNYYNNINHFLYIL